MKPPYVLVREFEDAVLNGTVDDGRVVATIMALNRAQQRHAQTTLAEAASEQLHHIQLDTALRLLKLATNALRQVAHGGEPEGPRHAVAIAAAYGALAAITAEPH